MVEEQVLGAVRARVAVPPGAHLATASLIRHKLGRRCLLRYGLRTPDDSWQLTVLGKMRARGCDHRTVAFINALETTPLRWGGPGPATVPPTLGELPSLNMWLQREAPGAPGPNTLAGRGGCRTAWRIGEALAAFHCHAPTVDRLHEPATEIAVLHQQLDAVVSDEPRYANIAKELLNGAARIVDQLSDSPVVTIHRDFYPDQVLVSPERITILDLDLAARGDPALDLGNFGAHLIEADLRHFGMERHSTAYREHLLTGYASLRAHIDVTQVRAYETLALIRHVALSRRIPGRSHTTARLIERCRARIER